VHRNPTIGMGGTALDREYWHEVTDIDLVRATIAVARSA
jgi:copper homeostasis protein